MSPTGLAMLGKLAAAPVAKNHNGSGIWSIGLNESPRLESTEDRPDKSGSELIPLFPG